MINSTMKASGKLEKGIIVTPRKEFLQGEKRPFRFQEKYAEAGLKKTDPYDYSFDKVPI